jgi:hypothetical protein
MAFTTLLFELFEFYGEVGSVFAYWSFVGASKPHDYFFLLRYSLTVLFLAVLVLSLREGDAKETTERSELMNTFENQL